MTAVECLHAVKFALWHVCTLPGLTWYQRIQLALLKLVAVVGYHHGKLQALQDLPPGTELPQDPYSSATDKTKYVAVLALSTSIIGDRDVCYSWC